MLTIRHCSAAENRTDPFRSLRWGAEVSSRQTEKRLSETAVLKAGRGFTTAEDASILSSSLINRSVAMMMALLVHKASPGADAAPVLSPPGQYRRASTLGLNCLDSRRVQVSGAVIAVTPICDWDHREIKTLVVKRGEKLVRSVTAITSFPLLIALP
jgi:hypothetical protein